MTKTVEIPVSGMSCAACAVSVETMLKETPGVQSASVNYATQAATLVFDEKITDLNQARKNIHAVGYELLIDQLDKDSLEELQKSAYKKLRKNTIASGILALPVFLIGMFWMEMPYGNYIMWFLTTPVLFVFGRSFFTNAAKQTKIGKANMDTLVALSTGIAYLYSTFATFFPQWLEGRGIIAHVYFETAAVIVFFILLGRMLEAGAKAGTSEALRKLIGLQPDRLIAIRDGKELSLPVKEVQTGELIVIKPGQRVPLDGILEQGNSYVDESMLTGEPIPIEKKTGDTVYAGTINQKGSFIFKATVSASETLLAAIIDRVKQAQGSKAPIQKTVDKVTAVFVPVVLGLAVLTFFVWTFSGVEEAVLRGMLSGITVLVIACPCALGLATPTAIMVGMGKAASLGILIRDAESLERGKRTDSLILDKTGTITVGKPTVKEVKWKAGVDETHLSRVFQALESKSEHPLATAIAQHFTLSENLLGIENFQSETGKGVSASYEGKTYRIGTRNWLVSLNVAMEDGLIQSGEKALEEGSILVYLAVGASLVGWVAISDQIREDSAEAVATLEKMGITVHMLTGDQEKTAATVAQAVGIRHFQSGMLPQDKGNYIRELQKQGHKVAMVGDGINDSEALVLADLGIAMGAGTDIAMETAKVTLMHSSLKSVPQLLQLSTQTVRTIRQNLFWAFIYNIIGIPIAAGVLYPVLGFLLNPMIAGAAMALSSVSVVSNSLRLKFTKIK
ncbi:heavy metal translocating P-type ATPase [Cyclobacterium jeungdonense]|uniref:Heavy metal translocating P-type ATPase n=1 Tax=Cyclobacterium jeungdonense TaxID=708087 RepID=A0ABT8CA68_9BACT|nr:heavy metal translocating P-type ATPase [Cyclobacterium jeungdonense]MDN3689693.1 heavy metal translocating P-type ATPase [Cyclobacterium jeungdonense]